MADSPNPIFVASTGRSGSTLLSSMLRLHPEVLSLSEVMSFLMPLTFAYDSLDGEQFWRLLSTPRAMQTTLLRHGLAIDEFLYPKIPVRRYDTESGVPPILLTALPHLTDDPEGLYDEMRELVVRLPCDRLASQYSRLFQWLCAKFGRSLWVERSGASLNLLSGIFRHFPDAKYIYLARDGRECALSMSRHHYFRLGVIAQQIRQAVGFDPFASPDRPPGLRLPPGMELLLPEKFDPSAYSRFQIPLQRWGSVWSSLTSTGHTHLSQLPPTRVLTLRYESLTAHPAGELARIADFLHISPDYPEWMAAATALPSPKRMTWMWLPPGDRQHLDDACRPGMALLQHFG
jgi:putative sulfotransferase